MCKFPYAYFLGINTPIVIPKTSPKDIAITKLTPKSSSITPNNNPSDVPIIMPVAK